MVSSLPPFFPVFTYGTLMTGYYNHFYLKDYMPMEGIARGYRRIWPTCRPYPVIERSPSDEVVGEIYYISGETKEIINRLEGIPYLYYPMVRRVRNISTLRKNVVATIYYPTPDLLNGWKEAEKECGNYPDGLAP